MHISILQKRNQNQSLVIGWIALIVMILSGSTYASFAKQLTAVFSPLSMLFISEVLMLFFATLSFGLLPVLRKIVSLKRRTVLLLLIAGCINGALAPMLLFLGLQTTSAINSELFGRSETLFSMLLGAAILHQTIKRPHIIGGSIILLGILFATLRGFSDGFTLQSGDIFIMLSAISFAAGSTVVRKSLHHIEPEILIAMRALMAVTLFFLISPFIEHSFMDEVLTFPLTLLPALLGFGFIARFIGVFSFYEAIERLPVQTYSLMATLTVAGSILFAAFYLGEALHWYHCVGVLLIILGAALVHVAGMHKSDEYFKHHVKTHHRHRI